MIWNERHSVFCRELIVSKSEMLHAIFSLDEIDETQRKILGLLICLPPLGRSHFNSIDVVVVAVDRPIDHILAVRCTSVSYHHILTPDCLTCFRNRILRIDRTVIERSRIISFRLLYGHISIRTIILEDGHTCKILNDIICLLRCYGLPCLRRSVHSYLILNSACFRHVTELRSINKNVCVDNELLPRLILECDSPISRG